MPRTARGSVGNVCYHVMTRGNARATVFHDERDYRAFQGLMARAGDRAAMRILAWCLMPNHAHLVLWPMEDGDLSRWMHWLLTAYVQRYRCRYQSVGRILQGRFVAPPVQQDDHLLTVMRYVERNALRAGLAPRAEDWPWSSLAQRPWSRLLSPSPVPLPENWRDFVNEPLTQSELEAVRKSARRGRPYGDRAWVRGTAERMGLLSTLSEQGRPRNDTRGRGLRN